MPKPQRPKLTIHLDLLKPQSNPEKLPIQLMSWLLKTGRYLFIFVEALVLIAFVARFKLDADLESKKESIDQQVPYIESLKPFEILIRQTQLKLSTIDSFHKTDPEYGQILKKIADQTPSGARITNLNLEKNVNIVNLRLNAQAHSNNDLTTFVNGLKQDPLFANVTVTSVGFEKGNLNFSLSAQIKLNFQEGKNS